MGLKKKLEHFWQCMELEDGIEQDLDRKNVLAELKADGCHCTIERDAKGLRLYSRRGLVYNETLPDIFKPFSQIKAYFRLEGELVYIDKNGHMIFSGCQKRCQISTKEKVEKYRILYPLGIYLFEITMLNGEDLTKLPYIKRRVILECFFNLQKALYNWQNVRVIPTSVKPSTLSTKEGLEKLAEQNRKFYEWAITKGFEGVVLKRITSIYESGKRSKSWLKVKKREHTVHVLNKSLAELSRE